MIVIAGNHDITFDEVSYARLWRRFGHQKQFDSTALKAQVADVCTYLEDSGCQVNGINIWGSPWQPEFCDWGFNLERGEPCQEKWKQIPDNTDVLITHGPPIGYGDECKIGDRAGCVDLLREIQTRIKPQYHVFGHIHEGYGMTTDGQTRFVNASTCTFNYKPTQAALIFDVPLPEPADNAKHSPEDEAEDLK